MHLKAQGAFVASIAASSGGGGGGA